MGTSYNSSIVTDGLVLCLDAANPRSYPGSGTSWLDLSGNGNNGTLTNGPTFSSNNAGVLLFDGSNQNVVIPHKSNQNLPLGGGHAVSIWTKIHSGTSHIDLISKDSESVGGREWILTRSNLGKFRCHLWNNTNGVAYADSNISPNFNQWYNVVQSWDGYTLRLYVDGKLDTSVTATFSTNPKNTTIAVRIAGGADGAATPYHLDGEVSLALLYQKNLTASEVLQNYNATRGRYGN